MDSFQEVKKIQSCNFNVREGSMAITIGPLNFDYCRERFARCFIDKTKEIYFRHKDGQKDENIADFLHKTEDILGQEHSVFNHTNREHIIWISVSDFWLSCSMRRSLLTIILKAAMEYDGTDYENTLFDYKWAKDTKNAIFRFLCGFTKYRGPEVKASSSNSTLVLMGWKTEFEKKGETEIRKMLIRPDSDKTCHSLDYLGLSTLIWK